MASKKPPTVEICEWTRDEMREHFVLLSKIVSAPKYLCPKCGRVANQKKWLCKTKKLEKQ